MKNRLVVSEVFDLKILNPCFDMLRVECVCSCLIFERVVTLDVLGFSDGLSKGVNCSLVMLRSFDFSFRCL